jgi:hypothetical protein
LRLSGEEAVDLDASRALVRVTVQTAGLVIVLAGLYFAFNGIAKFAGDLADVILHLKSTSESLFSVL